MRLTDDQIELYSRQIILRELGGTGQRRLLGATCLLRGSGFAFETAATYLAGAGLGRLDLDSPSELRSAFALPSERNPDVILGAAPSAPELSAYDVSIEAADEPLPAACGTARLGEIAVRALEDRVELLVVPTPAGCLACCASGGPGDPGAHALEAAQGGALAALAALRWMGGIDRDPHPRHFTLAPGQGTWIERPLERTATCPRPCRRS